MATLVKHYGEQVAKKPPSADMDAYPSPSKQLNGEVPDHRHLLQGIGSPKSVIRDHTPSVNPSYYYPCLSSSSNGEHTSSVNSQQHGDSSPEHLVDKHVARYNKLKSTAPQHHHYKESSPFEQTMTSNVATTMKSSVDHSGMQLENGQHGPHLNVQGVHHDFVPANLSQQQQQLLASAQTSTPSKPYDSHVIKGLSSASEVDANDSKFPSQYQGAPLNSLIDTLMQQYQPSFVVEDGKTIRHPCVNKVLADVHNGGFSSESTKAKSITPKWDAGEKWKLGSTHSMYDGLTTHNLPLFKVSNNEHTFPLMGVEQERFSLQPSHNKVHLSAFELRPCHFQMDASKWDKDSLKSQVEKLTDAVSCAQACLERIQPIPPPRNSSTSAMNSFLAQGVFRNRPDPTMTTPSTFKHSAPVDPVIAKSVLGSPHVPITGTNNVDLFRRAAPSSTVHLTANHALQKEILFRPSTGAHSLLKDKESRGDFTTKIGEHYREQKLEKTSQGQAPTTSYMKDASTEITPTSSHRDMGTQMTPMGSSEVGTQMSPVGSSQHSSQPHSPQRGTESSPVRHNTPIKIPPPIVKGIIKVKKVNPPEVDRCQRAKLELQDQAQPHMHSPQKGRALSPGKPNTPTSIPAPIVKGVVNMSRMNPLEVERCRRAKLELQGLSVQDQVHQSLGKSFVSNWSSREEEEEDIEKGLRYLDFEDLKQDVMEARALAHKEAARLKLLAKYEREETKIQAWEQLQAAKAEADLKKLEMKLEKKRIQTTAKIASKLCAAHKRAEERRAAAKAYQMEALEKTSGDAKKMDDEAPMFQSTYPLCACFTS